MAKNNGNALDIRTLVSGDGALTAAEWAQVAQQYRTADRAETMAQVKRARVAYVIRERGAMNADGNVMSQQDLAAEVGVKPARISQQADAYQVLVDLGVTGLTDEQQRRAYVAADRIRKYGKTDPVKGAVKDAMADILALDVDKRVGALDAATAKDGAMTSAVKAAKDAAPTGTREANNTPSTDGTDAATGKSDVLAALGSAVTLAADGVALTNGQADQVARYLAALVVNLGVSLDQVTDYVAESAAERVAA